MGRAELREFSWVRKQPRPWPQPPARHVGR
jgi:hypothetical protein